MDPLDFKPLAGEARDRILEYIRARITEADPGKLRRAMFSIGWVEGAEDLAEPLMLLVTEGQPEVALAALEGLAQLDLRDCEKPLARHVVDLFKADDPAFNEVRAECIRVLGKVGTRRCVSFLSELVRNPEPASVQDREAAVEALVSLAARRIRGIVEILDELNQASRGVVKQALGCALKELNLQKWDEQGYLTIEAEFNPEDRLLE